MTPRSGLLALTALLFYPMPVAARPSAVAAWPTGLYSNVKMHRETGDLGGMEIRFYEEAGKHMAEFVWCEGWCNETFKVELTRGDGGFRFHYTQIYIGGEGEVPTEMRFLARPAGGRLTVFAWAGDESADGELGPEVLRPVKRPFGITVANSGKE